MRHATVGCIVIKDNEILLAKRAQGLLEAGKWCFVGGYVDRDETTEGRESAKQWKSRAG